MGQLSIWIDDKPASLQVTNTPGYRLHQLTGGDSDTLLNRFNRYCNNRYRGQYDLIKLSGGRHKVTISISPLKGDKREVLGPNQLTDITENPEKYDQTVIYLGRILLRGKPIFPTNEQDDNDV